MTTPLTDALNEQGVLQPGDSGYWKLWGACVMDIETGDLVMCKGASGGSFDQFEITEVLSPREGYLTDLCRRRFRDAEGEIFSLGMLCPVIVLRKGTHNMLSSRAH